MSISKDYHISINEPESTDTVHITENGDYRLSIKGGERGSSITSPDFPAREIGSGPRDLRLGHPTYGKLGM